MTGTTTALVTGAGTGIGAATARALARRGVSVAINHLGAPDRASAEAVAAECRALGAQVLLLPADVGDEPSCRALVAAVLAAWGRLDYLVNNAGLSAGRALTDLDGVTEEEFMRVERVNVHAPFWLSRAAAVPMRAQGRGAIVNMGSIAGIEGIGSSYPYLTTKAALISLTKALARTLGPEIRVNVVCPGLVSSGWGEREMGAERAAAVSDRYRATTALRAVPRPEDIAETIAWLLQSASHMTGEIVRIDSGLHLGPPM